MNTPPRVLVAILNYNEEDETVQAIACYQEQTYPNFDLCIVDNGSKKGCVDKIREQFPDIEIIRLKENLGYTGGSNVALNKGFNEGYDYVVISNNDIVIQENLLANLVETAEQRGSCGIVGTIEEDYYTGEVRAVGGRNFKFWRSRGEWLKVLPEGCKDVIEVDYVQGVVVMFARRALLAGMRYDERLYNYCDEFDLYFQLREKRLKAFVDTRCHVRHKYFNKSFRFSQGYYAQRNRIYLSRKHASFWQYLTAVFYMGLVELPAKGLIRSLQGHGRYAWICFLGFLDGLTNRMSVGRTFNS